jgi:pimeloyl-ACP methyl ester carboxylesterase
VVPAYVRDDYVASYQGARWAGSARYARAYPQGLPALAERLSEIKTPVQVIAAKDDPYIPRSNPDYLAERLPNVQLNVADVEHIMWEENPDVFAKMVMDWAAAHPRS